jgi:excisionase family DNA binding protein
MESKAAAQSALQPISLRIRAKARSPANKALISRLYLLLESPLSELLLTLVYLSSAPIVTGISSRRVDGLVSHHTTPRFATMMARNELHAAERNTTMISDQVMTIGEVASALRLHKRTVWRLISRGDLKAVKFGAQWRIRQGAVEAMIRGEKQSA